MHSIFHSFYVRLKSVCLCIIFISAAFSCSRDKEKVPDGILSKDKMIEVLIAIHIIESSTDSRGLTSMQLHQVVSIKYEDVLKQHGTTYKQFKTSFDYYLHHPDQFDEIYEQIVNRLTALEGKAKANQPAKKPVKVDSLVRDSLAPETNSK